MILRTVNAGETPALHLAVVMAVAVFLFTACAAGQATKRTTSIGYVFPAGAQQGTTVQILAGGQGLRGAKSALVSPAEGVETSVLQHFRPLKKIDKEQRQELTRRFKAARERRLAEARGETPPAVNATTWTSSVELPAHPLLQNLDNLSLRELDHVKSMLMNTGKRQPNAQIAEMVLIEVTVNPDATPGPRQIRLLAPAGLTNPMRFDVGALPEAREYEPNDPMAKTDAPPAPPLELPVTINGQIMPGDTDRFEFAAKQRQRLVVRAEARSLVPYLADAVPGWFQAVAGIYDPAGREVAFADDFRFDPDPVVFFDVPQDGTYTLEIRDSIYRGREDFVYRLLVGELPFVTSIFPLGGPVGADVKASVAGWNLPAARLALDTQPGPLEIRQTSLNNGRIDSNPVLYAVDSLPECIESEPNDARAPQPVMLPCIINGRINRSGDSDVFEFEAAAAGEVVAEVTARRLNSPLDSVLRVMDAAGRVIAMNDDCEQKGSGLLTHHADSYLRATLPEAGRYRVVLADSQQQGGDEFAYRLRLSSPRPDFELRVTPSSIGLNPGSSVALTVYALRKDGFDGEIELVLKKPATGFRISGGRVPAKLDKVRISLTAPAKPLDASVVAMAIEGRARINGEGVAREAVPADDLMQAFAYRHLVPAQDLLVAVAKRRAAQPVRIGSMLPLRITPGGTATITVETAQGSRLSQVQLQLNDPPKCLTLGDVSVVAEGLSFAINADAVAEPGFEDNLIVDAYLKPGENAKPDAKPTFIGTLPAIPFQITK
ncbi:MAG: hypothetical protein NTZ09_03320 [Candidatus Hydrogenedentes bacterium]|nr:hypothetical protein [Candidatus Hydrogenedentota bacterium]